MPAWQGKSKGTRLGYRIFVAVLRKFGVLPAYFLLRFVAAYYFIFSWKSSGAILAYFQHLGFGRLRALHKLYRNYFLFGQTMIDRVVLLAGIPNRFSFDFDGEEHLRRMVEERRGGLLLSAHIGNWEIAGHLLRRLNTRIHIVIYDGEREQIKVYWKNLTGETEANIIVIKEDFSHIYAISDALMRNELVCMHADRFLAGNKTLVASLLDQDALFPAGPFLLAAAFRVPVSFVFALKESNLQYHFFASPWQFIESGDKEAAVRGMLADYAKSLEIKMRQYPEQWYNYYDFWQR